MEFLFFFCAVVGGTVLLLQFALSLIGFGAHEAGLDGLDGGDAFHAGDGADALHAGDALQAGDALHAGDAADGAGADFEPHHGNHHTIDHDSGSLFRMITFRSLVASLAFFGMAGMASLKANLDPWTSLGVAMLAGGAALYFVGWVFQSMHRLAEDGNVHIEYAVGLPGTVYIPIPGGKSGAGKIQLKLQNRIVELRAVTSEPDKLPTGASVTVVNVVNANTVEVELARKPAAR